MLGLIAANTTFETGLQSANFVDSRRVVTLVDGHTQAIDGLTLEQLESLQRTQEPAFAQAIGRTLKDSVERSQTIQLAYATICAILDEISKRQADDCVFSMGMDPRYADLVMHVLKQQSRKGISGGLFELGCSTGGLLGQACQAGYRVGGLEIVPELLERTRRRVSAENHHNLLLGDFRCVDLTQQLASYSVAYWNDVFEHIPIDEIDDFLVNLYAILKPGGVLITITPNWHMRPSDITRTYLPPRSEAEGFHLKEYTLREVSHKLEKAGFEQVSTPWFISRKKIYSGRWLSLTWLKRIVEPAIELLPFPLAVQCCRRFGLSCTLATKPLKR